MKPTTPTSLHGLPLSTAQRERLSSIISDISAVNPGRSAEANLEQSVKAFAITVRRANGMWVDLPHFRIGNGLGPVVIPSWSSQ